MHPSNDERLTALEAKVHIQNVQIDSLLSVLSDLLAAHAVLHKDVRLFSYLQESRNHADKMERQGGTSRTPASYFAAQCEVFGRLLEKAASSQVFDQYWFRSLFWRREQKARDELNRIRRAVQKKSDW